MRNSRAAIPDLPWHAASQQAGFGRALSEALESAGRPANGLPERRRAGIERLQ
jgi:hypothetical protein